MFNLFKKKQKCDHEWFEIGERNETHEEGFIFITTHEITIKILYCPKCDRSCEMESEDWNLVKNKQKLKREYNSQNSLEA